jgi:hypothetical protein
VSLVVSLLAVLVIPFSIVRHFQILMQTTPVADLLMVHLDRVNNHLDGVNRELDAALKELGWSGKLEQSQPARMNNPQGLKLTPEVRSVLERSTTEGNYLHLPKEKLSPSEYAAVNKLIVAEGGKWKKGRGHLFPTDAAEVLRRILNAGAATNQKKVKQAFYTPRGIAMEVAELAEVGGCNVLEPSAGEGALADACIEFGAKRVHCVESDPIAVKVLQRKGHAVGLGDFLKTPHEALYDRVVMNPPFTKGQDVKHVIHATGFLARGGKLFAILLDTDHPEISHLNPEVVARFAKGAFRESGTMVATILIRISK